MNHALLRKIGQTSVMTNMTRGRYAKSEERRQVVAAAALDLILEAGHRGLTTAAVAERAGMSERTLQYHFPTRDHVLTAALELYDERQSATMDWPEDDAPLDLASIPATIARAEMTDLPIMSLRNALAAEAGNPDHPAGAHCRRHDEASVGVVSDLLRMLQESGSVPPDLDPTATARRMMALWMGLQRMWLANPTFDLVDEIVTSFRLLSRQDSMETRQALLTLADQIS